MMNHRSFSLAYKIKVSGILFSFALDSQLGHRVRFGEYFTNLLSHSTTNRSENRLHVCEIWNGIVYAARPPCF